MKQVSTPKQVFLYVAPFPALAFFMIWAGSGQIPGNLLIVAFAMFLYCALTIWIAFRWDKPTYFDWAIGSYFAIASFLLFFWPELSEAFFTTYSVTGIYTCLFAAAFVPPLLGMDPFTYHYAKKYTPAEAWGNPIFVRINLIMTYVWAGLFGLCIALSIYPSLVTRALIPIALILGFGVPFNFRFPDYYLRRLGLPSLAEQRRIAQEIATHEESSLPPENLPTSAWEAISGMPEAFMKKAYTAEGNLGILIRMGQLFSGPVSTKQETEGALGMQPQDNNQESNEIVQATEPITQRKENTMKVLAVNSSPRGEGQSKTELMINHLVKGMREAGAEVEVVELRKKKVNNCIGCFTCWTKTPGVCIHKDDMTNELYPKWLESDLVVYATPLYHFTVNASMKAFIERTLPILQPFFNERNGRIHHPLRIEPPKAVFLSVAGFPEREVFEQLSSWANFIFGGNDLLVAEIYRPLAEMMTTRPFREKAKDILEATTQAGREIVESMKVSPETMERITQEIIDDKEAFAKIGNLMWKTCIAEGVTPKEFGEKGLTPRPDSIETFMLIMPMGFNAEAAGDTEATMQFHFTGEAQGSCYFKIENGRINAEMVEADNPDLTIEAPFEVWMDIMTGKADGQQMFMEQKYKAKGDLSLLLQMNTLFGR